MKTSEQIDLIGAALAMAQGQFPVIEKTRSNPFFKSKYADLSDILVACIPGLSKNELAFCQGISIKEARVIIASRLIHKSGQWIESELSIKPDKDTPQAIGSATTYGRRYAAEAILGVSATHDDDGNNATEKEEAKKQESKKTTNGFIYAGSELDKQWLFTILKGKGITDFEKMKDIHNKAIGKSDNAILDLLENRSI